jgi:hypothetical protein
MGVSSSKAETERDHCSLTCLITDMRSSYLNKVPAARRNQGPKSASFGDHARLELGSETTP